MRTMDGNLNKRQFYPYTIYTNQNHEYHAENLIFYSIEQKGLFTDNGRRTPPPQKTAHGFPADVLFAVCESLRQCVSVCERFRHQQTDRPEMETRTGRTN